MAQPSNTFDSYDAVGIREDLQDVIYNISPKTLGRQLVMISSNWVNCWKAKAKAKLISSQASNEEGSTTIRKEYIQVNGSAQPLLRG